MKEDKQTFAAPVVYTQPSYEELKRQFSGNVNPDFEGRRFEPIEARAAVSRQSRIITFEYVCVDHVRPSTDEVLAEIKRRGLRPALYEEMLCFAEKYPDEQQQRSIVALGSVSRSFLCRHVSFLWENDDGRRLGLLWVGDGWNDDYRFLAVRE